MFSNVSRLKIGPGLVLVFIGLLWFGTLSLRALDRYVVEPGTIADGNGGVYSDWSIAATQIQWAINASTNANDTIWVSNGTYVLTNQIVVISNIVLRSTNGPDVTIVNGNFTEGSPATNRCLYLSNKTAFVSGFTFSNGACDPGTGNGGGGVWIGAGILSNCTVCNNTAYYKSGGGILIRPSGTATACRVTGNIVTNSAATYGGGGGIAGGANGDSPGGLVYGCIVSNNRLVGTTSARSGGGIAADANKIRSTMICNNSSGTNGYAGGVYLNNGAMVDSCTVSVNEASLGGGTYLAGGTVTNCLYSSNWGMAGQVAGIYLAGGYNIRSEVYNTTVSGHTTTAFRVAAYEARVYITNKIINCIIENNGALGVELAGITTNYSMFMISNCVVRNNKAGGVSCTSVRNVQIRNCLIANNTNNGSYAGFLLGNSGRTGTISVSSCTIVSNYGTNYGAGIIFADTNGGITVSSCVIASNGVGGTNDVYDMFPPTNYNAIQYSCLGLNPGFTGTSIIVTNPQFADFAGGNFRLSGNSPCVNAGSNETWMTNAFDLDKRARIRYGAVDMGAYEIIRDGTIYGLH